MTSSQEILSSRVTLTTITSDLVVHFRELKDLVQKIQEDMQNNVIPLEDIDTSLAKLSVALEEENERISKLFETVGDGASMRELLSSYDAEKDALKSDAEIIESIAVQSTQLGDFSPLLFSPTLLDDIILEKSPGIPDTGAHEYPTEAEYQGVPYPLP